jgi:hypothetical protein
MIVTLIVKHFVFKPPAYDSNSMSRLKFFKELFQDYFHLTINTKFIEFCLRDYYLIPIFLLIGAVFYLLKKKYVKLAILTGSFFGYLLLTQVTNYGWPEQFYMESQYLILVIIVIVPVVFDVLPEIKNPNAVYTILALLIVVRLFHIMNAHKPYTARLTWNEQFLAKTSNAPNKKMIIDEKKAPMDTLKLFWGSSFEWLLLSSISSPDSSRCLMIHNDLKKYEPFLYKNKTFFNIYTHIDYNDLPKQYFAPRDTSRYILVY